MQIVCSNFLNIRKIFDFFNVSGEIVCDAIETKIVKINQLTNLLTTLQL